MAVKRLWKFTLGLVVCFCSQIFASNCELGSYSKLSCLESGDYGKLGHEMCTICNLFVSPKGEFLFRQRPSDKTYFPKKGISFPWKPATTFSKYNLIVRSVSEIEGAVAANETTTVFIVPRLEGNYCHAVNDAIAPMFWRIRQQQNTSIINISRVVLFTLNDSKRPRRDVNHFIPFFSSRPAMTTRTLPSGVLHIREAVVGAMGMTVHLNQNYYWHGNRYLRWPTFSMRSIYKNLRLLGQHLRTALHVPDPQQPRIDTTEGLIVLANRKNNSRGRSMLNADQVLESFKTRFGKQHNVHPNVVYFEELSMPELAALLARTKVLLAPHGAGLSNVILMRRGGALIELIPYMCHRLRIMFSPVAQAAGLRYSYWQPTDNLVPDLTQKSKVELIRIASTKGEPCSQELSRTNFLGSAGQLGEEVAAALDDQLA